MHTSIYDAVMAWKDLPSEELFEKLEDIYPDTFEPLLEYGGEPYRPKMALLYIIQAYSKQSPYILLGEESLAQKTRIYEMLNLPPVREMQDDLIRLNSEIIRSVILGYLKKQEDRRWRALMRNRDMFEKMSDHAVDSMHKDDGSIDFKGMVDAARMRADLLNAIEKLEAEYAKEYSDLHKNEEEVRKIQQIKARSSTTLGIENSPYINSQSPA